MLKVSLFAWMIVWMSCGIAAQNDRTWHESCITDDVWNSRYASYSPDGTCIAFESDRDGDWNVFLMNSTGSKLKQLTHNISDDRSPTWHPGGSMLLYVSSRKDQSVLILLNLDDGEEQILATAPDTTRFIFPSFSPDAQYVTSSLRRSSEIIDIVLFSVIDPETIKTVLSNGYRNVYPKWSASGEEIVYFSRKDTENKDDELYRLNLKSGTELRLTYDDRHNFCPAWSSDNTLIAYARSMEDSRPEIYVMDSTGTNKTRITYNQDGETLPSWHPQKNKLLITAYRNGFYQICELSQ